MSEWNFHVAGGYSNDGNGGGDGSAEIHNLQDSLLVYNRDGHEIFSKPGAVTAGKVKISLANNEYSVESNDKLVHTANQVTIANH